MPFEEQSGTFNPFLFFLRILWALFAQSDHLSSGSSICRSAHTHTESTPQQKADREFPTVNDFLGTIPIKGCKSLWSGISKHYNYCRTLAWTAALALLPSSCCTAHPVLKHSKSSFPAWEIPWQLIPARQFPRGISSARPGASPPHHQVCKWKMFLELNVLAGLSQPKLSWDCDSMIKPAPPTPWCQCCWQVTPLQMTFAIKFHRGLSAWLSGWIRGLFMAVTLNFQGGVGAVGAGAVQRGVLD